MTSAAGGTVGERTISVCVPTLGRPSLIETCVASLEPQWEHLHQLVIAVHGAAVLPEVAALASPQVTVVRFDGANVGGVRNAAAAAATGDFLLFLDDDDALAADALASIRALVSDGQCVFASGGAEVMGDIPLSTMSPTISDGIYGTVRALFLAGTFVIDRLLFSEIGGYDESMRHGENHELGIRISEAIERGNLPYRWTDQVLVKYAPSGTQYDVDRIAATEYALRKHRQAFGRAGRERGRFRAVLGVLYWRHGRRWTARKQFLLALAADPGHVGHWGRLAISTAGRAGDKRWSQ